MSQGRENESNRIECVLTTKYKMLTYCNIGSKLQLECNIILYIQGVPKFIVRNERGRGCVMSVTGITDGIICTCFCFHAVSISRRKGVSFCIFSM